MRRAPLALIVACGAFFVIGQEAAFGQANDGRNPLHTIVGLKLKANNGLTAVLENSGNRITLTISGHRRYVIYSVHGKISEVGGINARFGKLGRISLAFRPTRTVDSSPPPPKCKGEPWTTKKGVYEGTFRFRGERHYVDIDASEARGEVSVYPEWKCPSGRRHAPSQAPGRAAEEGDVATLSAGLRATGAVFVALAIRDPKERDYTIHFGGRSEKREAMKITRLASCNARSSTFLFDHEAGTAMVSPPWPFRGSASFQRRPGGRSSWTGNLSVPLLGAAPVTLSGPRFHAALTRDFPSD